MARYTGPRLKVLRRLQAHLPGLTRKSAEGRPHPPGVHGQTRRVKQTDFRVRLVEKQKLRFNYGVSEKQLRRYFKQASAFRGDTGLRLLAILESRLDNIAFRAGLGATIPAARQLVSHGHVLVNGRRVTIPSYRIQVGDVITLKESSQKNVLIMDTFENPSLELPTYLTVDKKAFSATINQIPARDDVPLDIQENLVVEYYSRIA